MQLGELAKRLNCRLEGPAEVEITGVNGLEEARESEISFLSNPKYAPKLPSSRAAAFIVGNDVPFPGKVLLRSDYPYLAFAKALEIFFPPYRPPAGIHPTAVIATSARLGRNASIGPYVVIEDNVEIGDDCILKSHVCIYRGVKVGHRFTAHSHVSIRENVRIGDGVTIHNGAVIGADGFGFAQQADGSYYKIVQAGDVEIGDNVEIQANTCIDRGTVGMTRLRAGVKVDNLVHVGHACDVGENTLLCAQVGLSGSTKVGKNAILTGQVGVAGHLTIGDGAIITAQSGIPNDVRPGAMISGSPGVDHQLWLKCSALYRRLPAMFEKLQKLEKEIKGTKSGTTGSPP
jgi:UDP-3-O-[3-hydroxymyristoyl] glucosamine N-acyltransferase